MLSSLVLAFLLRVHASDQDLFKTSNAKNPTALAQQYVEQLPKVGALMPKDILHENIRRDFMPRLMATENDRASYELGLETYEKLNSRGHNLLELSHRVTQGERIRSQEKKEMEEAQEEASTDLNSLSNKIQEGEGQSSPVTFQALKLMANSIQSYTCAFMVTEKTVLNPFDNNIKQDCAMPFPGSFIMLDQKVLVPEKITITLPDEYDKDHLHPENWMTAHLRRKVWCPSSSSQKSVICDGVTMALQMPTQSEIPHERDSLHQAASTMEEDPKPEIPEPAAPRALMEGPPDVPRSLTPGELIKQTLQANKLHKLTLLQKQRQVQKEKFLLMSQNKDL